MKIGLVILHADPARGGAERYTVDIARALSHRGHDVAILASSFDESLPWELKQIPLHIAGPSKTWQYKQFLDQLDMHLVSNSYDVLHAMLPVRWCDVYHPHAGLAVEAQDRAAEKKFGPARVAAKIFGRFNFKRRKFAAVERSLLAKVNRPLVVCLSDHMKRSIREFYALNESDLVTLMNAVDLQKFNPATRPQAREQTRAKLGLGKDQIAALIIAQDFARKGLRETIMATAKARVPNLQLIVVGKDDPARYEELAKYWEISERVHFIGEVSDVYAYYRAADFFVLPTRHDPCSLVVLEAMAMGLPVISTKLNGATELMQDGVDGFILPDPRVDALADAMRELCDPKRRQTISDAVMSHRAKLSFDQHINLLLKTYQNAAARRLRGKT